MLRRFLIIGVGGSGGKTARFIHQDLRWRLQQTTWTGGLPVGWQFLQIDVPTVPDGDDPDIPEQLPAVGGAYYGLAMANVSYAKVDGRVLPAAAGTDLLQSFVGWRPDPHRVRVSIERGAGQYRALGRMLALSGAGQIQRAIRSAIDRINAPGSVAEMERLSRLLGNTESNQHPVPVAVIISSMGGGSGAGMVSDVADILRASGETWTSESFGLLFTGDVFHELPPLTKQGVQPNSLAALSELLAGYWNHEAGGVEFEPLAREHVVMGDVSLRGVRYPFLIGRSSGAVPFGSQNDVYGAIGKTMAAVMSSAVAQDRMVAYLSAQWPANAAALQDLSGLRGVMGETPFQSLGSASVALGRDRFRRYASQRLARASVEHLLRGHWAGKRVPEEILPEDALEQAVNAQLSWFVESCGLDELGEENNQVIDAIRPTERVDRLAEIRLAVRSRLDEFKGGMLPTRWAALLVQDVEQRESSYSSVEEGALRARAITWIAAVQARIEAATVEAIGRAGAEVAAGLVDRLRSQLSSVVADLEGESQRLDRKAQRRVDGVNQALAMVGANNINANNPGIEEAIRRSILTYEYASEARLRRLACALLRDMAEQLLEPLHQALTSGIAGLRIDEHPVAGPKRSVVDTWPVDDVVPASLSAAINERLIEEPGSFPATYLDLLKATLGEAMPQRAERRAIGQVVTNTVGGGTHPADGGDLDLGEPLVAVEGWWPEEFGRLQTPTTARYELRIRVPHILERAEEWVSRRDTAIGDHVHQSLRDYLTRARDAGVAATRQARFLEVFKSGLNVAGPLIKVSNAMLAAVHGLAEAELIYTFTEIPLDQTPVKDETIKVMRAVGTLPDQAAEDEIEKVFGTGTQQRIEIITYFQAPFEPMVFDSVMKPIAAHWANRRGTPEGRSDFWTWRRARSLPDFVPVPPEVRRSMVTGWFVGRLLGELTWDLADLDNPKAGMFVPLLRRRLPFPDPLLGPLLVNEEDLLPAVLESLPLAMVDSNTRQSLEPLMPYGRLRELGEKAQNYLQAWILANTTPGGGEPDSRAWCAPGESTKREEATAEERKQAVLAYLNGRRRRYVERLGETIVDHAGFFEVPRHFDLRDDYRRCFEDLHRLVALISTIATIGEGD